MSIGIKSAYASDASPHQEPHALSARVAAPETCRLQLPGSQSGRAPLYRWPDASRISEDITPFVHSNNVPIIALLNNYTRAHGEEGLGDWDPIALHEIVSDAKARARLVSSVKDWLIREKLQGSQRRLRTGSRGGQEPILCSL